jgi:hypothetical protein
VSLWISHIIQQSDARRAGDDFSGKLELFCRQTFYLRSYSRHIAGGPGVVCSEAKENWIGERANNNWNFVGCLFEGNRINRCLLALLPKFCFAATSIRQLFNFCCKP